MGKLHALVMGASGSAGWALVDELLKGYGDFGSVSALVNRPLTLEGAGWTPSADCSLQIISAVDLTRAGDDWCHRVDNISKISHIFNAAFKQEDDPAEEFRVTREMIVNFSQVRRLPRHGVDGLMRC